MSRVPADAHYVVLVTPYGRWTWWPALQAVDYTRRGRRRPVAARGVSLSEPANTLAGAVRAAARAQARVITQVP